MSTKEKFYILCRRTKFMAYTEIKKRNKRNYYYRVRSIRKDGKVSKKRIYLGADLTIKQLSKKELEADKKFQKEETDKKLLKIKPKIEEIIKKRGIKKAGIFGSYAKGKQKKESDIDILVEPTKKMGLFDIISLENELKESLNRKVDLLTYASLNKFLKKRILDEEVRLI